MSIQPANAASIAAAVAALRAGDCVGLPTETVYGLAADAENPTAVRRIFELKGRPADHPLIVHLPAVAALERYAVSIPDDARALAARFWPGPLTMILRRSAIVSDVVTGGQDTVGLRVPAHPVAQTVLRTFGRGLAAPSANRFGRISPTSAAHVLEEFGAALPIILDGGECTVGIESTIVDCSGSRARVLRPGMIDTAALERVVGGLQDDAAPTPRVSGLLEKHYAPRAPLRLMTRAALESSPPGAWRALALHALPEGVSGIALPNDPMHYAHDLYAALRRLDQADGWPILVEAPPDSPAWTAIRDRLQRAAAGSGEV